MASIKAMINWMEQRKGKVTYSMASRLGPASYDCSSAVYFSLVAGEFLAAGTMGNTDTLFGHLENSGWKQVNSPQRGDVFVWGSRGASGGAAGHTGIFVDGTSIIHCNYGSNGISIDNYAASRNYSGNPPATVYRNTTASGSVPVAEKVKTPEEKRAWAVADVLNGLGYNFISIAGILGNIDVETGGTMDPDTIRKMERLMDWFNGMVPVQQLFLL